MSRENLPDQPGLQALQSDGPPDSSQSHRPGMIEQGYQQFLEDLDGLLRDRRNHRKLAAYHGRRGSASRRRWRRSGGHALASRSPTMS